MQSRTFLRIEGDLVSLVSEVIDREVALPDLLAELTTTQVQVTPRLPIGCRFWIRSGAYDRQVFVVEQAPMRRTVEYQASRRQASEPVTHRLALPYVVFVVSTTGEQIEGLATYFRTAPLRSLDDPLCHSCLPNTSDEGLVCLGSVRVSGATVGERVDALIGAFWASRFNQDLRRHPLPFSGGFRSWASRSRRDPLAALSLHLRPLLADPPPGRGPDGEPGGERSAGRAQPIPDEIVRDRGPDPGADRRSKEVRQMPSLREVVGRTAADPTPGLEPLDGAASSGTTRRRRRRGSSRRRPSRCSPPSSPAVARSGSSWSCDRRRFERLAGLVHPATGGTAGRGQLMFPILAAGSPRRWPRHLCRPSSSPMTGCICASRACSA